MDLSRIFKGLAKRLVGNKVAKVTTAAGVAVGGGATAALTYLPPPQNTIEYVAYLAAYGLSAYLCSKKGSEKI